MDRTNILTSRKYPIEYTNDQEAALNLIAKFLKSHDYFFLLSGYSGCGKTTIAENIANFTQAVLLAPTNAAKTRIKEKINNPFLTCATLHSFYSIGFDNSLSGSSETYASKTKDGVIIIDECSMIDKYVLDIIIRHAVNKQCKVIFIGDSFQLEPVGENPFIFRWENTDYKYFKKENKYNLSEVKRYDGVLLNIATELRKNKKAQISNPKNSDFTVVTRFSKKLAQDIKNDKDFVVITSTNKKRVQYNYKIRSYKYNDPAISNLARHKDKLVSIANTKDFSNGETFTVNIPILLAKFQINIFNTEDVYDCLYYADGDKKLILIPDLEKAALSTFDLEKSANFDLIFGLSKELKAEIFTLYKNNHYHLLHRFDKTITLATYGYAISCHKAQGQEWDNVYIDAEWLMKEWHPAKWFYTAITRAKCKVEVTSNKYLKMY